MTQDSQESSMPHVDEGTLHAYLDGELPSAERNTLEAHLAECGSCRAMLAEERALLERASALLGAVRPADREAPPFEQLRAPQPPQHSAWRVRTPVAWAASIALALGLGYYLHQPAAAPVASLTEQHDVALLQRASEQERSAPATPSTRLYTPGRGLERAAPAQRPAAPMAYAAPTRPAPPLADARESLGLADAMVKTPAPSRGDSVRAGALAVDGIVVRQPTEADRTRDAAPAPAQLQPQPQPRNVAAAPAAQSMPRDSALRLEEVIVAQGEAARRGRVALPTTTSWPIISHGAARSLLGTDPVGLPGLARKIRRNPANDGTVVVEQQIDSATTIQIFQRQNATAGLGSDSAARSEQSQQYLRDRDIAADRLARYVGRLRVEISGPLSTDSLNKLLEQVQPLP